MATVTGGSRCSKCRQPHGSAHHPACPEAVRTERARQAWEYGYDEARRRVYIPEHRFKTLHPSRVLGYQTFQDELDEHYDWMCHDEETDWEDFPDPVADEE